MRFSPIYSLAHFCYLRSKLDFSVCVELTFNLGVKVVDNNLKLPQRHVSQVGGLQAPLHETLADVRHVRQLNTQREAQKIGNAAPLVVIWQK